MAVPSRNTSGEAPLAEAFAPPWNAPPDAHDRNANLLESLMVRAPDPADGGEHERRRMSRPTVSVVIPTLNEGPNLEFVLPRISPWIDEVIVVDGRSTDGTPDVARHLLPGVRIVRQTGLGKGDALRAGFEAARGDLIIMLDADGSTDPREIPAFVGALAAGADFVKGTRFAQGAGTADMSGFRNLGNRGLVWLVRMLFGGRFSDLCYGYIAFWKRVLPVLELDSDGFEIETQMNLQALRSGLRVVEIPSFERSRIFGESNLRTIPDGWRVLKMIVRERRRPRRDIRGLEPREVDTSPTPVDEAGAGAIDVSVVICACAEERFDDLSAAVHSIAAQTVRPLETTIVVDHNPALAARARAQHPSVIVIENLGDRGVSATRNVGIAAARGAIVAFLDDDAIAAPDWLERMLDAYTTNAIMAVGGAIAPIWQTGHPRWFPDEFGWVVGCSYTGLPDQPMAVRNVIGTNMSFRHDLLDTIGGFDTTIGRLGQTPVGCDETELCVRAHQHWPERTITFDPRVRVSHHVPTRRSNLAYFVARCYGEGRSKALVSEHVGQRDALSTELRYATHTLPAGVVHGLRDAVGGDASGLGRAAAIVTGLAFTSLGFLGARVRASMVRSFPRH